MLVLIFSFNRALQLDATLRSLMFHCEDISDAHIKILYKVDSKIHSNQYAQLQDEYRFFSKIQFVEENNFRADVISLMAPFDHVLYLVDDNIFVEPFKLTDVVQILNQEKESIGLSLRLGKNTDYCYSLNCSQSVPNYITISQFFMRFNWTSAEADFGYPLELSSSVYSIKKILPLLQQLSFNSPNTLEATLNANKAVFQTEFPLLLSYEKSKTFCVPINKVQTVANSNRVGNVEEYSSNELAKTFRNGKRIDIANYIGFTPNACHQEVDIVFLELTKKLPLVSVIIPCYKQANFLPDSIGSVLNQTYTNWECIVVNDGSPDNTSEVVNKYISDYPEKNISLLEIPNGGLSFARNRGVEASRGEFILPFDSDDKFHPEYFERFVEMLLLNPDISFVYCDRQDFGISNSSIQAGEFNFNHLIHANHLNYCSMYRRSVWDDAGGYDESLDSYEDWDFWISAGKRGHKGKRIAEFLFYYRVKEQSMYTDALERDPLLRAQIVCNHPELYTSSEVENARKLYQPISLLPLVSVIVPTMNRPKLLERALRSLVDQTYKNWQAIVVNDAGEDVQELVMSIDFSNRIQYVSHPENKGLPSARNTAIKASAGSIICYLDDDDVFLSEHLTTIVDTLNKKQAEFVYCEAVYVVEKDQNGITQEVSRSTPLSGIPYSKDHLDVSNFIPVNTWGHRRELLDKSGFFDTDLTALEDWEMLLRFSRLTNFIHVPKLTVEVHQRDSSGDDHMLNRERSKFPQLYRKLYDRYPVDSRKVQNKRIALLASWGIDYKPAYIGTDRSVTAIATANSPLEKTLVSHGFLGGSLAEVARTMVKNNPKEFAEKEKKHELYFDVAKEILHRYREQSDDSQQSTDSVLREASHLLSEVLGEVPGMKEVQVLREEIAELQQTKDYQLWMHNHQLREIDGQLFAERMVMKWNQKPVFHCIMFLFPGEENLLADTLDSFGSQLYQEWRLTVIAETPAPDPLWKELEVLEWVQFNEGANPYELLNSFVFEIPADWVAIIEPGVRLVPHALIQVADYINIKPSWKLIYTDEDIIDAQEGHIAPKFKPDFNLDMLRSQPYIGNACFVKWDALKTVGGYEAFAGIENHDIALKVFENFGEKGLGHIADVLFHFSAESHRVVDESILQKAVQAHLLRSNIQAVVQAGYLAGTTRVVYEHNESPLVSIVIQNQDKFEYIEPCLKSIIEKTDYPNYGIIIVDYGSTDTDTLELYANMQHLLPDRFSVVNYDGKFNYSAMCNKGMENAKSEFVLFLNYDTEVLHAEWLSRMMAHAQRPDVGVVGARLTFPETSKLQHAGQILGLLGGAEQPYCDDLTLKESGYMERVQIVQNYSSVSERCMLVKREAYQAVAGMDEQDFAISFNNVDLCLKIRDYGLRVVWTPYATLVSYGSTRNKSDGGDYLVEAAIMERSKKDRSNLLKKWMPMLANDPAYNPNLSLAHRDFRIEMQMPRNWDVNFHDRERILGFPSRSGSGDYRVIQPFDALSIAGLQQSEYYRVGPANIKMSVDLLEIARLKPDTLVVQAAINDLQMHLVEQVSEYLPDVFRIFTMDDLITDVPTKSSAYRDNQRYFKDVRKRLRKVLSKCNRLIVTTQPLADAFSDMIDNVRVIPNRLVKDKWVNLKSQRQTTNKPRVGWVGAQQHQGDLEVIYDVIKQTTEEVDWIFMGMCPDEIKPYVQEYHKFVSIDQYPEKMASLNLDLAIAPLEVNSFNEAKSNLRLLEYGVLGWPVVCTDIYPYRSYDAPVTRVDNTTEEWVSAIRAHINDLIKAGQAGDCLRDWVLKSFILEDHLSEWQEALLPEKVVITKTEEIKTTKIVPVR